MWESLTNPRYRRATIVCAFLAFFNQFTGINVVSVYSTKIFEAVNENAESPVDVQTANFILGFAGIVGAILSWFTFNYLGKRSIFMLGHLIMGLCFVLAYVFTNKGYAAATVTMLCLCVITF